MAEPSTESRQSSTGDLPTVRDIVAKYSKTQASKVAVSESMARQETNTGFRMTAVSRTIMTMHDRICH